MRHLSTDTIVIRRAEPEDYRGLQQIAAQPLAIFGSLKIPYPSAQTWRQRLEKRTANQYGLVACVRDTIVGSLGLVVPECSARRSHTGQLGLAVHDEWHGRGIGTALVRAAIELADRWLNLQRLELTAYTDNAPAIRLYGKFGFEVEGMLRRYAVRDGAFVDAYLMARLR